MGNHHVLTHLKDAIKYIAVGSAFLVMAGIALFVIAVIWAGLQWAWYSPTGKDVLSLLGFFVGLLALAYYLGWLWYHEPRDVRPVEDELPPS